MSATKRSSPASRTPSARRAWDFVVELARKFLEHRGLLLASALAYNALLALLPLSALLMLWLSTLIDPVRLRSVVEVRLRPFLPGGGEALPNVVSAFIEHRDVVGFATTALLLLFSVFGVRTVKQTLEVIFDEPKHPRPPGHLRDLLVESAVAMGLVVALALVTMVALVLDTLSARHLELVGIPLTAADAVLFRLVASAAAMALLAMLYVVLAPRRVHWRSAILAAVLITLAWQPIEAVLGWFFENLSIVGVLYGSVASLVVGMISLELGATLFLVGAQAIALSETRPRGSRRPTETSPEQGGRSGGELVALPRGS